jgi:hypothetical protein
MFSLTHVPPSPHICRYTVYCIGPHICCLFFAENWYVNLPDSLAEFRYVCFINIASCSESFVWWRLSWKLFWKIWTHRYLMSRLSLQVFYLWRHVLSTAPPFILWWSNFEILFAPLHRSSPFIGGLRCQAIQTEHGLYNIAERTKKAVYIVRCLPMYEHRKPNSDFNWKKGSSRRNTVQKAVADFV